MITDADVTACVERVADLCRIPSPSGYTGAVESALAERIESMGLSVRRSRKRSLLCDLGGSGSPLVLAAHVDTLGAMVRSIKTNGRLRFTRIGGYPELYIVSETCRIHTRDGHEYTGTFQPVNPAVHVNPKIGEYRPQEETIEVVVDLPVKNRDEVESYGIRVGDFISLDARTTVTETGYLKSRHLDDKASAGVLLTLASLVADGRLTPARRVYLLFTTYEEVGHGGSSGIPEDVEEMISVDMGAVGDDLTATEHQVSICAKDSGGPYDYHVTGALARAAEEADADYAIDIYPRYGSDVEATLRAGFDIAHGLIGPGVSASHGYERTHADALGNTLRLLERYISTEPASAAREDR